MVYLKCNGTYVEERIGEDCAKKLDPLKLHFDYRGELPSYLFLHSPAADGTTNCNHPLISLPWNLNASRKLSHHEITLTQAQNLNADNYTGDYGENWILKKSADICSAAFRETRHWCAAQVLDTKSVLVDDIDRKFQKAVVRRIQRTSDKLYNGSNVAYKSMSKYSDETLPEDDRQLAMEESRNMDVLEAYESMRYFHVSVIGPVYYNGDMGEFLENLDVKEHVRWFTGDFKDDRSFTPSMLAHNPNSDGDY